jgi:hypothetical protein
MVPHIIRMGPAELAAIFLRVCIATFSIWFSESCACCFDISIIQSPFYFHRVLYSIELSLSSFFWKFFKKSKKVRPLLAISFIKYPEKSMWKSKVRLQSVPTGRAGEAGQNGFGGIVIGVEAIFKAFRPAATSASRQARQARLRQGFGEAGKMDLGNCYRGNGKK